MAKPTPVKRSRTYGKPPKQSPNTRLEIAARLYAGMLANACLLSAHSYAFVRQLSLTEADALIRADRETANAQ